VNPLRMPFGPEALSPARWDEADRGKPDPGVSSQSIKHLRDSLRITRGNFRNF